MESVNLNKVLNQFLDWKITFTLHWSNGLQNDLYKGFLKFKENFPKNETTTNNSLLSMLVPFV